VRLGRLLSLILLWLLLLLLLLALEQKICNLLLNRVHLTLLLLLLVLWVLLLLLLQPQQLRAQQRCRLAGLAAL
jgi:hypothetical protein